MGNKMKDRVAIVTGGCGGVGIEVSRLLAKEGASVVIADMNDETGMALAGEINSFGG